MPTTSLDRFNQAFVANDDHSNDASDQRFSDAASLWQRGDYDQVVEVATEILDDGIYDIRVIVYYLYCHYLNTGPHELAPLLRCLNGLLHDHRDTLLPSDKQELHIRKSIHLLFDKIYGKLTREERTQSAQAKWQAALSLQIVDDTLASLHTLQKTFSSLDALSEELILSTTGKLIAWYTDLQDAIQETNDNQPLAAPDESPAETHPSDALQIDLSSIRSETGIDDDMSYPLQLLLKKIKLFEVLIDHDEMKKAAIIMEDVREEIANFDPRRYFPKLFTQFSALQAAHIQTLSTYETERDISEWRALEEYYRVDMEGFFSLQV